MTSPSPPSSTSQAAPARLAVLLSGSGRTLVNLLDHIRAAKLSATIPLVIASRECVGAQRARSADIPLHVIPGDIPADELSRLLADYQIDLVALAGYLRLVNVPSAYRGRIVNIHPALLPAFGGKGMYGDRVHAAVIASRAKQSGCTVHVVDDVYDQGPILLQKTCPVLPNDDPHTLAARVFGLECEAYPEALQHLIRRGVQP